MRSIFLEAVSAKVAEWIRDISHQSLVTLLKLPLEFTALACSFLGSFIMIKLAYFTASPALL
jgi:hypothetical protein